MKLVDESTTEKPGPWHTLSSVTLSDNWLEITRVMELRPAPGRPSAGCLILITHSNEDELYTELEFIADLTLAHFGVGKEDDVDAPL